MITMAHTQKPNPRTSLYMVLNDGETFTSLSGCKIVEVNSDFENDQIEAALGGDTPNDIKTITVFN